jgi:hypothetical protein
MDTIKVEFEKILMARLLALLMDRGIHDIRYNGSVLSGDPITGVFVIAMEVDPRANNTFKIASPYETALNGVSGSWDESFEMEFRRTLKEYLPDQSFSEESSSGNTRNILSIFRQACLLLEDPTANASIDQKVVPLFPRKSP